MHYVSCLNGDDSENAWHYLVDLGPLALPYIRESLYCESDNRKREQLIQILAEHRDEKSLGLFSDALYDPAEEVWKTALDAIVTVGGSTARDLLQTAEAKIAAGRREWLREALEQISVDG
jgi:hypothetical protein